jgi:hypothetical protein
MDDDVAGVRVRCIGSVGRCAGRLVLRDRRGPLGSAPVDIAAGAVRTVRVSLRRDPRRRFRATVTSLQPGGYVKVTLRLRRGQNG